MSVGHRHNHPIDASRERELQALLGDPDFAKALSGYSDEDDQHDIPYGGGSSTNGHTVYWDRRLAPYIEAGKFKVNGVPIDPRRVGRVHEAIEGALILHRGRDYPTSHDMATIGERHAAAHAGIEWNPYQDAWREFLAGPEHENPENPPDDLLLEPYRGTPLYRRLATAQLMARMHKPMVVEEHSVALVMPKRHGDK